MSLDHWRVSRTEPLSKILYEAKEPLFAVLKALPVEEPRLLVASAIDDLTAAACRLGEESPQQYLRARKDGR